MANQQQVRQQKEQQVIQQQPSSAGEWPIDKVIGALSRKLPTSMTETRTQGGKKLTFIPWHVVNKILDKYAVGWTWTITNILTTNDRIFITGRLTIPTADGDIWREATGTEELKEVKIDSKTGEVIIKERAYGDPSSNAESMAFRRAAARFGLGLYLYEK